MLFFNDKPGLCAVLAEATTCGNALKLVHGRGIYLTAAGSERYGDGGLNSLSYAQEYHPSQHPDGITYPEFPQGTVHTLTLSGLFISAVSGGKPLRAIIDGDRVLMLYGCTEYVPVEDYRDHADRMYTQAKAHFSACRGNAELVSWRRIATERLSRAAFIDCHRAKPDDHRRFVLACQLLHQRLNCVTPEGALRIPIR